jgi:hypothetical protein
VPVDDQRRRGKRGAAAGKIHTRYITILLLTRPQESAQTKHRQSCLRPLDEVSMLGLGNTVAIAPVGASGHQHHDVAKMDTAIITWRESNT